MTDPPSDAPTQDAPRGVSPSDADTVDATSMDDAGRPIGSEGEAPRIAHYFLLERLGAGAMGVVYAAYDPDLDRKVAIKLLRRLGADDGTDPHHQRLVREARSLAKLSHPNVVTVHAVGESARGAYVAMEYVEGTDLHEWTSQHERGWREVTEVYLQAARGLAAAHRAGIIHRDFKPANVLIGKDGVVRVADFGLARVDGAEDLPPQAAASFEEVDSANLTQTGGVLGTPLYMAPEQHMGEKLGPAADQYAFCASLFEGIHGQLPFSSRGLVALLESKLERKLERPTGVTTPRWLSRAIERGLAPKPEDRFPDMDALIAALEAGLEPRRLGWWLGGGAVITAATTAFVLGTSAREPVAPDPCADVAARLSGVWDDAVRDRVRTAFVATGASYAQHTWDQVSSRLDAYAASWVSSREHACRAHEAREESDELFDLRAECLEQRRSQLSTTSELFSQADVGVVEHALDATGALLPVEQCDEPASFFTQRIRPEDPEARAAGREALVELRRLVTLRHLRQEAEFQAGYEALAGRLDDLVDHAARAELLRLGSDLPKEPEEKIRMARLALHEAIRSRDETLVLHAYDELIGHLLGSGRVPETIFVLDTGMAILDRASVTRRESSQPPLDGIRGEFENFYGMLRSQQGDHAGARAHYERSLALAEPRAEQHPSAYIVIRNNYGEMLRKTGNYEEALEHYGAALKLAQETYGADHPETGKILGNRGAAALEMGRFAAGRADVERVLALQLEQLGPRDPQVGLNQFNLGLIDVATGQLDVAETRLAQSRSIFEEYFPPPSPYVGIVVATQGSVARARGDFELAKQLGEESMKILRASLPGPHELLATGLTEQGATYYAAHEFARAEPILRESLEVFSKSVGTDTASAANTKTILASTLFERKKFDEADRLYREAQASLTPLGSHPSRAEALALHAELLTARGELEAAEIALREALTILEESPADPLLQARARFRLAQVLSTGEERDRLVALARAAFTQIGSRADEVRLELETWADAR